MAFKCKIGLHSWNGCKCVDCEKTRDEQHEWLKDCEKCSRCGKASNKKHDWSKDCHHCLNCNTYESRSHIWDGCICSRCGKTRDEKHTIQDCKCIKCGKYVHFWNTSKCIKCGKAKSEEEMFTNPLFDYLAKKGFRFSYHGYYGFSSNTSEFSFYPCNPEFLKYDDKYVQDYLAMVESEVREILINTKSLSQIKLVEVGKSKLLLMTNRSDGYFLEVQLYYYYLYVRLKLPESHKYIIGKYCCDLRPNIIGHSRVDRNILKLSKATKSMVSDSAVYSSDFLKDVLEYNVSRSQDDIFCQKELNKSCENLKFNSENDLIHLRCRYCGQIWSFEKYKPTSIWIYRKIL